MENLKIEAGKFYRLRDGRKALVCGKSPFDNTVDNMVFVGFVDGETDCVGGWLEDGRWYVGRDNPYDLIAEWVEPKRIKGWLNFDADGLVWLEASREEADEDASDDRIACIEIDVLEGQGLDGSAHHG